GGSEMKRRDFLQTVASVPAGAVLLEQPAAAQTPAPSQTRGAAPPATPNQSELLQTVAPDAVATTVARFFSGVQFATLRRLADLLMPPLDGTPGALEAQA